LDDIYNLDAKRVLAICDLITRRNLKLRINFPNAIRTDALTEEVMDALVGAGLYHSCFALESGSPRIQKFMRKHLNIDKFLRGVGWAIERGVFAHGFTMLGFPTETEEDMQATVDVACNSRLHTATFFTVVPFPGTELHDYVAKHAPDKLKGISYEAEYAGSRTNVSEVPDEVLAWLGKEGFDPQLGARPLKRLIQQAVVNRLSRMILEGTLHNGEMVVLAVDGEELKVSVEAVQ